MLVFSELKNAVGSLLERTDSTILSKIETFINDGYRYVYNCRPWFSLLRQQTFASTAGLDYFITGPEVGEIVDVSQRSTPIILALQRYHAVLSRNFDALSLTGNPTTASPMGEVGVMAPMAANGTIDIVSSSAIDTTQKVRIRGYDANLTPITELITLTGTTPATSTSTFTAKEGFEPRFTKDLTTVGTVTTAAGAVTLARLAPSELEVRYKKWKVFPAFQSSITMYLTFKKRISKLVEAEDTPEIECDNALIMFAFARALQEKRQFAQAQEVYGKVDADARYPAGTFMAELDALTAKEPQFSENFIDQFIPIVSRDPIDQQDGSIGHRLWPA